MRSTSDLLALALTAATGFGLVAAIFMSPGLAFAGEPTAASPECTCPGASRKSARPKFASTGENLDHADERAALESVQIALTRLGDKQTYVWHRENGRLSGLVQPTSTFRNADGNLCRHLIVMLTTGDKTRKTEAMACRLENGVWQLDG